MFCFIYLFIYWEGGTKKMFALFVVFEEKASGEKKEEEEKEV